MAERKTDDPELEKYLEGNSPLSQLYSGSDAGEPSEHIDETILKAARHAVSEHSSASQSGYRWYVPVALAASLILVIFAVRLIPIDDLTDQGLVAEKNQQGEEETHNAASKATPDLMLEKINQLVADGKQAEAQEEYQIFEELFPDYRIDYQKYPQLKKLTTK